MAESKPLLENMIQKGFNFEEPLGLPIISDSSMVEEHWKNLFFDIEPLGGGGFGSVFLAQTLNRKTKVVIKFINIDSLETSAEKDYCIEEPKLLKNLQKLKHEHIMKLYLWFTNSSGSIIIVSPYYEGVTLNKFVENYLKNNEKLEEDKIY